MLAAATPAGTSSPGSSGYGTIAVIGLVVCLTTSAATWLIPGRAAAPQPTAAARTPEALVERG